MLTRRLGHPLQRPRLDVAVLAESARRSAAAAGAKVRLLGETSYQTGSWPVARRVVMTAEVLANEPNTRFVVISRADLPRVLYAWYTDRGESEHCINDLDVRRLVKIRGRGSSGAAYASSPPILMKNPG